MSLVEPDYSDCPYYLSGGSGGPERLVPPCVDLRHLQASFLFAEGYDAVEIGARLGHAGGALALNLYGHFSPARDRIAAASLGSVLPKLDALPPATREDEE